MNMNYLRLLHGAAGTVALLTAILLTGCQSAPPRFQQVEGLPGAGTIVSTKDVLQPGELISIEFFSSASQPPIQPYEERIKEDGTISPPQLGQFGPVKAAGKLPGQLQKELQELYERLYRNITVVVTAGVRVYWVDGEVTKPGVQTYLGPTDVMKAVAAAGGFTPFANKRRVHVIRTDGTTERVNYNRIIEQPSENLPVYPGDKVWVPRRLFW